MSYTDDEDLIQSIARRVVLIAMEHDVNVQRVVVEIVDVISVRGQPVPEAWCSLAFIKPSEGVLGITIKDEFKHHAERINAKLHSEIPRLRGMYGRGKRMEDVD